MSTGHRRKQVHDEQRGWHSRGYLPHFDGGQGLTQSVTFRLADAVPAGVLANWIDELKSRPSREREAELRKRIEAFIDTGCGACHLLDARVGKLVEDALLFFDGERYHLHAWVVMPNHVHALFTPLPGESLSNILGSWKSFASKEANKLLLRSGRLWQEDYFDRFIHNAEHFARVVEYIENNPVKAGLCNAPADWSFGSARLNRVAEAAETAALPGVGR